MKLLFIMLLTISASYGSVWPTNNSWNDQFINELKIWIKSKSVTPSMFTSENSPYYGIKADCADVTYVLRAVFAYENQLPFKVKNPVYRSGHKYRYWGNGITKFDHIRDPQKRFIAFANFLGASLGTETLNINDSYPLKLEKVSPSDFYSYKVRKSTGGALRHSYNIKDVKETGNFVLIWSNQQRKKEGKPMLMRELDLLSHRPYKYKWGFRRVKFPEYYNMEAVSYMDFSTEQYSLAKKLDEHAFFKHVKSLLQKVEEDPNESIQRHLNNLCTQAKDRVQVVQASEKYRLSINDRCMDYREYDDYSTPARDGRFFDSFLKLKLKYEELTKEGTISQVNSDLNLFVENLFNDSLQDEGQSFCQIQYIENAPAISLKTIYRGFKKKQYSFHPNDNIHRRWGVSSGIPTSCKRWY